MILSTKTYMSSLGRIALPAIALLLALAACSDGTGGETPIPTTAPPTSATAPAAAPPTAAAAPEPIQVVVTNNIIADWVKNVGGDRVEVFSLLPIGADPHTFQPGARDVARVADADLVLSIGLGLEESWLHELIENAKGDESAIVELGETIDPIEFGETHAGEVELLEEIAHVVHEVEDGEIDPETGIEEIKELLASAEDEEHHEEEEEEEGHHSAEEELREMVHEIIEKVESGQMTAEEGIEELEHLAEEGEDEHADHGHGIHDPHFWFDPIRVKTAINDIAERLTALDSGGGDSFSANASAYNARLDELHSWTEQQVSTVPADRRLLVTSHDSLGYFAELYGFVVVGVILSFTTDVDPSPADLAHLVEEVKEFGVPAVFGETTVSERLATALAAETGAALVRLYSGSLGEQGSGADTYIDMVRTNVNRITEALR